MNPGDLVTLAMSTHLSVVLWNNESQDRAPSRVTSRFERGQIALVLAMSGEDLLLLSASGCGWQSASLFHGAFT
jgi:hypothetical protein